MAQKVLVLGDCRQSVTVVRSLARAGFVVVLGCDDRESSTALSRYVSDTWIYDWSSPERFCDHLEAYLRDEKPDFVFTIGESQLRRLIDAAPRFDSLSTWVAPDWATIARCFDKSGLYELAPRLGIPSMPWRRFTNPADWRLSGLQMGFPVVVKRNDSAGTVLDRKALICSTVEQFDRFLATLPCEPDPGQLVLQKYLRGVRHNCHVASADGRLVAYFQQKVLSTDELDDTGIGTAGVSVAPMPELRAHCEQLTLALGYTGIGCIQFLVDDATGAVGFLEFNARMDSTAALPYALGYDYPLIAVELARYRRWRQEQPSALARPYACGKSYHWLLGDFVAWQASVRNRRASAATLAVWAFKMSWMTLRSHPLTFEWRDPLPTLHMYWRAVARPALRRLRRAAAAVTRLGRVPPGGQAQR